MHRRLDPGQRSFGSSLYLGTAAQSRDEPFQNYHWLSKWPLIMSGFPSKVGPYSIFIEAYNSVLQGLICCNVIIMALTSEFEDAAEDASSDVVCAFNAAIKSSSDAIRSRISVGKAVQP